MKPQKQEELATIILHNFPTPIAVLYNRMLNEDRWELKTRSAIEIFEVWMRSITLQMLIHYLDQDIKTLHNEEADKLNGKINKIYKPLLGDVVDMFFSLLKAYRNHSDLLFMKELYNIQWQAGTKNHVSGARGAFEALTTIRNDIAHGRPPRSEAAWEIKYDRVDELLHSVLGRFQFVKDYRIVYTLEAKPGKGSFLQLHGLEPARVELEMPETESVQVGRFYLDDRRDQGHFYELHPLFLPWPSDFLNWKNRGNYEDLVKKHTAIYERYQKPTVHFAVHTEDVEELVLTDQEAIARFLELFEERPKLIQPARSVIKRLHWREFQRIANGITQLETEAIREKFSKDLYLQRQHIRSAFEHFLRSDKVAFVLLGQSGVGKSNFVLSMYEAFRESPDTHLIVFNSARLSGEEKLVASLTEMFANKIALVDKTNKERKIEDILEEIDNIDGILDMRVILAFDAINENSRPHELLKRIDDLVSYNKYPWLKVMITSRPEAWQSMKRQYRLTESRYYRQPDTEELEVELKGFDQQAADAEGWLAMDRFKPVELPKVYALYQEQYRLKTNFEQLSAEMKVMLRDPLALRLIAETYGSLPPKPEKDGILPQSVRTSKLYEHYINSLIDDGRLERADVEVFLKQKLLPLMFRPGEYHNKLDAEILTRTIDKTSGKSLSEEIELDDILPSTGKRVNQSFYNLANAGILIKQGSYSDYEISFKYERFYDFFGGQYLSEIAPKGKEQTQWYLEIIAKVTTTPFLWGAIEQALLKEINGDEAIAFRILSAEESTAGDLLENVLLLYVNEDQDKGFNLLDKLYSRGNTAYKRMVLRVAGITKHGDLLRTGGLDKDKVVRLTAILSAYFLWQLEAEYGWRILEFWGQKIRRRFLLPNLAAAESAMGLSILILTDKRNSLIPGAMDYRNPEIYAQLQPIWKQIIADLLWVSKSEAHRSNILTSSRSFILTSLVNFIFLILGGRSKFSGTDQLSPIQVLQEVFGRDTSKRRITMEKLRPYWDSSSEGITHIENLLLEHFSLEDPIPLVIVQLIIQLRAKRDGDQDLSVVEKIYRKYFDPQNPAMAPAQLVFGSGHLLSRTQTQPSVEAWEIYTRLERSHLDVDGAYTYLNTHHESNYLSIYTARDYELNQKVSPDLMLEYVNKAIAKAGDPNLVNLRSPSLASLIAANAEIAIVFGHPQLALRSLVPIVRMLEEKKADKNTLDKVTNLLGIALARVRLYHRDSVDNFLEDVNGPDELRYLVRSTTIQENLWGDYLASRYGSFGLRAIHIPQVRQMLWKIFEYSLKTKDLKEWLNLSLREIVNFVYGGRVFPI